MVDLANAGEPELSSAPAHNFLAQVEALLDWRALAASGSAAHDGEPALPVFAIKIALLKDWYGLADDEAQALLLDRLSCRAFLEFAGDGSPNDIGILNELKYGTWARVAAMATALTDAEQQLRERGYAVRTGELREPSLMPRTESRGDVPRSGTTSLFDPGELGRMLEAVTAKAHADGIDPTAPVDREPVHAGVIERPPKLASLMPEVAPRVRAVLEWPWGARSELSEHLNIGRDYAFSPLAKELTPYTHVSRRHAELLVYGEGVWVRDLGSRNGTYVNDQEVPRGQATLIDASATLRFGPALAVTLKIYD